MPFENYGTRAFTAVSIDKNVPSAPGVYGLSNARAWLFVGESDNLRARLLEHLREGGTALKQQHPTGFAFELCAPTDRIGRVTRLILELRPTCNAGK